MASDEHQGFHEISGGVWRACAGKLVHLPKLDSRVYYFADGHGEQASSKVNFPSTVNSNPAILCRLTKLTFLADPRTEEVLVKFKLIPLTNIDLGTPTPDEVQGDDDETPNSYPNPGFVSYNKILTVSDANNGGGFSVPRYCAETIFPQLNFNDDPPVMNINIADVKGHKWEFRHIYRGTPRRHLLTTGWSKYVNAKYLIAGDTVVFIRNTLTQDLFVGLRRAFMGCTYTLEHGDQLLEPDPQPEPAEGFSREKKGRVPPKAVLHAADRAVNGLPFEAVFYPRPGMPEFVVAADKVEAACRMYWTPGTRVKMSLETDDGLRETWHNGSISSVTPADNGTWPGSCWRMIEVSWDEETEALKAMQKVNPWQLKFLGPTPPTQDSFPPFKKYKGVHNSGLPNDAQGDISLPTMGFRPMMDHLNPTFGSYNTIVDGIGMQGTRHLLSLLPSLPTLPNPMEGIDKLPNSVEDIDKLPNHMDGIEGLTSLGHHEDTLNSSASRLAITSSPSDTSSADSKNAEQSIDKAAPEQQKSNSVTRKVPVSFQLFGNTIHAEQPLAGR